MPGPMNYTELKNKMRADGIAEQEAKFNEMTTKGRLAGTGSESPWGEVATAPSQTVTGAMQSLDPSGKSFEGSGGYEYGQLADGSFMILKSGRGHLPGSIVKPGMRGYKEIQNEFENAKAGRPVAEKPRAAAASKPAVPKSEAPKPRVSPTGPTEYERASKKYTSSQASDEAKSRREQRVQQMAGDAYGAKQMSGPLGLEKRSELVKRASDAFVSVHGMPESDAMATAQAMADSGSFSALEALASRSRGGPQMRAKK